MELAVRYVHFLAILALTATLAAQNTMLRPALSRHELRRLTALDALYGTCALLVLAAGLLLWLGVGKPADFYNRNPLFHIKFTLFGVTALLSLVTTTFLLKKRNTAAETVPVPGRVRMLKRVELAILALLPLLAALMARGVGIS